MLLTECSLIFYVNIGNVVDCIQSKARGMYFVFSNMCEHIQTLWLKLDSNTDNLHEFLHACLCTVSVTHKWFTKYLLETQIFWTEIWNNLPTWCNWIFIWVLSARHVSGLHAHLREQWMLQFPYICSIWCPWFSLVRCRSWGVCVLVVCCTSGTHTPQDQHLTKPRTPYATYIRNCNTYCSWRWTCKPETCQAERTQINIQLHQVGKLFHISNQNARYN